MSHNYFGLCSRAADSQLLIPRGGIPHGLQLLQPAGPRICALQQEKHRSEQPAHRSEEEPVPLATREKAVQQQRPGAAKVKK